MVPLACSSMTSLPSASMWKMHDSKHISLWTNLFKHLVLQVPYKTYIQLRNNIGEWFLHAGIPVWAINLAWNDFSNCNQSKSIKSINSYASSLFLSLFFYVFIPVIASPVPSESLITIAWPPRTLAWTLIVAHKIPNKTKYIDIFLFLLYISKCLTQRALFKTIEMVLFLWKSTKLQQTPCL